MVYKDFSMTLQLLRMSRRASRASLSDGEFMLECKAAYLSIYDDVKDDICSKDELVQGELRLEIVVLAKICLSFYS